jgi:LEA14-like dessication related protein
MEQMNFRVLSLLLVVLALCSACSPAQIKGRPPFVSIAAMLTQPQSLSARFDIRNINDVEMAIDSIELTIRARDVEMIGYGNTLTLTVDPNTTEEIALDSLPDEVARPLLAELERGDVASLPFFLEGRVHTRDDGYLPFSHEGHLYPVPGKPGQFRAASSRMEEER